MQPGQVPQAANLISSRVGEQWCFPLLQPFGRHLCPFLEKDIKWHKHKENLWGTFCGKAHIISKFLVNTLSPSLYCNSLSLPSTLIFFFSLYCLGSPLWHMEVLRLGVESELQLPAYATATATPDLSCIWELHYSSQPCRILNALSEVRDQTLTSWILVGFLTC